MTTLRIEGMSCGHCVRAVEEALTTTDGVTRVLGVDLDRGEARIEGAASTERLARALDEEGYRLVAVDGTPLSGAAG